MAANKNCVLMFFGHVDSLIEVKRRDGQFSEVRRLKQGGSKAIKME